ncbi:hypothetical protein ASC92_14775 [Variovorax sp. Root411]|nr:hypothetical protein ASC92_14775 [Variovorax sp. Root411]
MAANLLPQFEQLGGSQASAGSRLFATGLLALRGAVGRHRVADFAAAHLADPEEIAGHRQRRTTGENENERQGEKWMSH